VRMWTVVWLPRPVFPASEALHPGGHASLRSPRRPKLRAPSLATVQPRPTPQRPQRPWSLVAPKLGAPAPMAGQRAAPRPHRGANSPRAPRFEDGAG
jgi:hypothetical protein